MTDFSDDSKVVQIAFATPEASEAVAHPPVAAADPSPQTVRLEEPAPESDTSVQTDDSTIEQRLESFIGFNAEHYVDYYQTVYQGKQGTPFSHWHWVPLIFSIPWLFIRRRYFTGAGFALVSVALYFLFPSAQTVPVSLGATAVICGVAGRPLYMWLALRKIDQVEARRLWPVQRDEQLHRAGGVSLVGAMFGVVVLAAIIALPIIGV